MCVPVDDDGRAQIQSRDAVVLALGGAVAYLALVLAGRLTPEEHSAVAKALWKRADCQRLPGEGRLRHWVFLCMPETVDGIAEEWCAKHGCRRRQGGNHDTTLDEMLFHIGNAKEQSRWEPFSLDFSDGDAKYIVGILRRWAIAPLPRLLVPAFEMERIELMHRGIRGVTSLLVRVELPGDVAEAVYSKQQTLLAAGTPAMSLLPGLVGVLKDRTSEIHTVLRKGLSSADSRVVASSAGAMQWWLDFAAQGLTCRTPMDLVREIGVVVATRRSDALADALRVAEWVFNEGEKPEQDEIQQLASEGLVFLVEELAYGREFAADQDVPLLRAGCVGLARAMYERGCRDEAILAWLEAGRADPLPEVWHKVAEIDL